MKSLSHRNSKIYLLDRLTKKEISQTTEKQEPFTPCYICTRGPEFLYQQLKKSVEYIQEIIGSNFEPSCVSDSDEFILELNRNPQETAMDSLSVEKQIACHALDDLDIPYHLSPQNQLRKLGLHVTKNPGFTYTEEQEIRI